MALVLVAIITGFILASHRARANGIGWEQMAELCIWVIAGGFLGGHIAKSIYDPDALREAIEHPVRLINIFGGQASFGSFFGGALAAMGYFVFRRVPFPQWRRYSDAGAYCVPFSWWIGRTGCYLVHDHPGIRTTSWLGVRYPDSTRYDLGLLEALFLLGLAAVFAVLGRKPRRLGFFTATFLLTYGVFRIYLDTFHIDPPRYAGVTVDQYAGALMALCGVAVTVYSFVLNL